MRPRGPRRARDPVLADARGSSPRRNRWELRATCSENRLWRCFSHTRVINYHTRRCMCVCVCVCVREFLWLHAILCDSVHVLPQLLACGLMGTPRKRSGCFRSNYQ